MPANYDSIIEKLAEDPEFLDLSPDEQDQLIQEIAQETMGVIPNSENFLQRAIKNAGAFIPQSREELGDMPNIAAQATGVPSVYNLMAGNPVGGMVERGANFFKDSENSAPKFPEPSTEWGKEYNKFIGNAQLATGLGLGGLNLAKAGGRGVGNLINSVRTSPLKKQISSIEDLILQSKQSELGVKDEISKISELISQSKKSGLSKAKDTAYLGAKEIKNQVSGRFKDAGKRFGEEFSKLESRMGDEDLEKVIKNAAKDIGAHDISGSPANILMNQIKKYGPKPGAKGIIQTKPRIYNKEQVQAITREILDSLPDDRSKAIFHKHLLENLSESIPGLKELKASHAPIYKVAKESKFLKESNLRQVARGEVPPSKLDDLSRYAENLGSSHVERAKKVAQKNNLERMMLEQSKLKSESRLSAKKQEQDYLGLKLKRANDDLGKALGRKNWAIGAVTAGIGLPIIGSLYKKFFGEKSN